MIDKRSAAIGAGAAIAARALLPHLLRLKFRRDVERLNAGDYRPLLASYADDAVLRFNAGPHRWSGEHRGKPAIERFLQNFTAAGIGGELGDIWIAGPPWALTMAVRFNDRATAADGEELYSNSVAMVLRTRWGKVVEHDDFFLDTGRITTFEERLRARGVQPAPAMAR
ncbi:MAG TPA: nuclear transport factor 2 family protein [Solirubrobacteraceae bacterium]|nr:nuclear transport factor 2 family protein [Solirubrobacteraceae bacterium]